MPSGWVEPAADALGAALACGLRGKRRIALRNLALVYGGRMPPAERRRLLRRMWALSARHALELLRMRTLTPEQLEACARFEGLDPARAIVRGGRGVVLAVGHLGNWDLAACAIAAQGIPMNAITRSLRSKGVEAWWFGQRERLGLHLIPAKGSAREILRKLKGGEMIAMVLDQNRREGEGIFLDFLGVPALVTDAPARFAVRSGAAFVTFHAHMEPGGRHRLVFEPEIPVPPGVGEDEAVRRMTEEAVRRIERRILDDPAQWIWMHRRWRTRPPGQPPLY